jgi:hypothetical protein
MALRRRWIAFAMLVLPAVEDYNSRFNVLLPLVQASAWTGLKKSTRHDCALK